MTDAGRNAIRSVAVLGDGIVGLSAAVAFARALPGLAVTVVGAAPDPAALADHMPGSLPSIAEFHDRIGVTEAEAVAAGATHRIAIRFDGWTSDGRPYVHAFGDHGRAIAPGAFHQHWLNARRQGQAEPFDAYSGAAALAAAGKFVHPSDDPASPLSRFEYALRLDPPRYCALLLAHARRRRIAFAPGRFAGVVRREDGGVAALALDNGGRVEADLFLDCAGPSAPIRSALDARFEDWGEALPCDRLLLADAPPRAPTSCDEATAVGAGWRWAAPLRDRTITGFAYAARLTSASRAARIFPSGSDPVTLRPGFRPDPWLRNVLALGDAAVAVDPLEWTNLHLAQSGIVRALDLLPGRDCHSLEVAEYNRRTRGQAERVRDFVAAHFLAAGRRRGEFWGARRGAPPDSLAHTLAQFAGRGRLPHYEEESFGKESWLAVFLGLGMVPSRPDPVASAADPNMVQAALRAIAASIAALPGRLPPYGDYLSDLLRQRR